MASNGKCIKAAGTGTAKFNFTGSSGTYNIKVKYFDENDGSPSFVLYKNGTQIDSWIANQDLGYDYPCAETLISRTKNAVSLSNGDEIKIQGTVGNNDFARVDCIEITQ